MHFLVEGLLSNIDLFSSNKTNQKLIKCRDYKCRKGKEYSPY